MTARSDHDLRSFSKRAGAWVARNRREDTRIRNRLRKEEDEEAEEEEEEDDTRGGEEEEEEERRTRGAGPARGLSTLSPSFSRPPASSCASRRRKTKSVKLRRNASNTKQGSKSLRFEGCCCRCRCCCCCCRRRRRRTLEGPYARFEGGRGETEKEEEEERW